MQAKMVVSLFLLSVKQNPTECKKKNVLTSKELKFDIQQGSNFDRHFFSERN
jgi:hypothetical protein